MSSAHTGNLHFGYVFSPNGTRRKIVGSGDKDDMIITMTVFIPFGYTLMVTPPLHSLPDSSAGPHPARGWLRYDRQAIEGGVQ